MGGQGGFATLGSAELYDPSTGQWSSAGTMATGRYTFSMTLLADGRVLVAGGSASTVSGQDEPKFASSELYDPATNQWTAAAPMATARASHAATLLNNGKVLVTGGWQASGNPTSNAELYDPINNQWTATMKMRVPRANHTATPLPDGRVFTVGGWANFVVAEIYNPASGTWSPAPELNDGRAWHSATLLKDGMILVAGGVDTDFSYVTSAELLDIDRIFARSPNVN